MNSKQRLYSHCPSQLGHGPGWATDSGMAAQKCSEEILHISVEETEAQREGAHPRLHHGLKVRVLAIWPEAFFDLSTVA